MQSATLPSPMRACGTGSLAGLSLRMEAGPPCVRGASRRILVSLRRERRLEATQATAQMHPWQAVAELPNGLWKSCLQVMYERADQLSGVRPDRKRSELCAQCIVHAVHAHNPSADRLLACALCTVFLTATLPVTRYYMGQASTA